MKRSDFVKAFREFVNQDDNIDRYENFDTQIELANEDKSGMLQKLYLANYFSDFCDSLSINCFDLSYKAIELKVDWSAMEDADDIEGYLFALKINVNQLYDEVIANNQILTPTKTLYRVENDKGEGLYSSFFGGDAGNQEHHTDPADDTALSVLFSHKLYYSNSKYSDDWHFAFNDMKDLKEWIHAEGFIPQLYKKNFCVYQVEVPESAVILGEGQCAFQKSKIARQDVIDMQQVLDVYRQPEKKISFKPC